MTLTGVSSADSTDSVAIDRPLADGQSAPQDSFDLTGRDRLLWNVVMSWASHAVFLVAGFIMPREIDRSIGQIGLGVWDFAWTAVNYFYLAQIGVGVSVNRYVARYRAAGDREGLSRMISSVMILQLVAAVIVMAATAASAWWLPQLFGYRLHEDATVARDVIALLGTSVAIRMAVQAFSGVVTGCHRWDLHNLLNSGAYAVTVAAMMIALASGGGLVAISVVYVIGTVVNEVARVVLAYHVCPELHVSPRLARYDEMKALLAFGVKLSSLDVVKILTAQLTSLLVFGQIGVATLAIFSRMGALIRHTENLLSKFSLTLTPTASSLQGSGREEEVQALLVDSTRYSAYITWPILIGLAIVGDDVLRLWMGPQYDPRWVLTLMALASLLPITQQPIATILVGLNRHGRFAALNIVTLFAAFAGSVAALRWFHFELLGLAAITFAVSNLSAVWIAVDTCRRLSIPVRQYFFRSFAGPVACMLPFAIGLIALDVFIDAPLVTLAASAGFAAVVVAPLYWFYVVPPAMRVTVVNRMNAKIGELRLALQPGAEW